MQFYNAGWACQTLDDVTVPGYPFGSLFRPVLIVVQLGADGKRLYLNRQIFLPQEAKIIMENPVLPYLTADISGVGGHIKETPQDFFVEEIPRYEPVGEGHHVYAVIEKTGLTTLKAIRLIANALQVRPRDIGYAGLKDAHAVTRQTLSIPDVDEAEVGALQIPNLQILRVQRHTNKLRVGHLAGNRFVIRLRQVPATCLTQVEAVIAKLQQVGVPNYFGEQRFGVRHNTHLLGRALLKQDLEEFLAELLGRPQSTEHPAAQQARAAFDAGQWDEASRLFPGNMREERLVLQKLIATQSAAQALKVLDKRLKRLFVSAFQSDLFNQLLAERLEHLALLERGDVAYIHNRGACFLVEDPQLEQPRADTFEISPSGPLFGKKYLAASDEPGLREEAILDRAGVSREDFEVPGLRLDGTRRPFRIPLHEVDLRWDDGVVLGFNLPPGAYATTVLREVMKTESKTP